MFYLVAILFTVAWIMLCIVRNYVETKSPIAHKYLNHGTSIELIWTITPAVILILIAFPSFKLLYLMDEITDPSMTVLAEGLFYGGPKSYILKKSADSCFFASSFSRIGQVNQFTITRKSKYKIFKSLSANCQHSMFHTRVKSTSRIGPHNQDVISVIIGSLLGSPLCFLKKPLTTLIKVPLDPNWTTGFTDAEGTFVISIIRSDDRAIGWRLTPIFSIKLHGNDLHLLKQIQSFFGVGNIVTNKKSGLALYNVKSAAEINHIIIPRPPCLQPL